MSTQSQSHPSPAAMPQNVTLKSPSDHVRPQSRLKTFRAPTPSPALIRALAPVNRWLMLGGIPGLRRLPVIGYLPGVGGLMNIPEIEFSTADKDRLKATVNSTTAAFVTPNHPEFFTDWMLDKEVLSRAAPLGASWATHEIVNGLGPTVQKFWLKNNLIAQIPGAGGQAGKEYSVSWARKGNGVLLHPEGSVGWHGDNIGKLFPGAAEMALETARQISEAGEMRPVFIAPVVWKLFFTKDVTRGLHKELSYVERTLHLPKQPRIKDPAQRLHFAYDALLARDEVKYNLHPTNAPYFERKARLEARVLQHLEAKLSQLNEPLGGDKTADTVLRQCARWLRRADPSEPIAQEVKAVTKDLIRLRRMRRAYYKDNVLTQEHVAECIKRIRADYCRGGLRDTLHNYMPVPVGPRRAVVRVPEPIEVTCGKDQDSKAVTDTLQDRMQASLDTLNADNAARQSQLPHFQNPFL